MKKVLYGKKDCTQCFLVKTMFTAMELEYEYVDIEENPEARELLVEKSFMGLPVFQVEDEFIGVVSAIQAKARELV